MSDKAHRPRSRELAAGRNAPSTCANVKLAPTGSMIIARSSSERTRSHPRPPMLTRLCGCVSSANNNTLTTGSASRCVNNNTIQTLKLLGYKSHESCTSTAADDGDNDDSNATPTLKTENQPSQKWPSEHQNVASLKMQQKSHEKLTNPDSPSQKMYRRFFGSNTRMLDH